MNSHFKNFFEFYFDYPFEQLEFFLMNQIDIDIAKTYQLDVNDIETFFIHKKNAKNSTVNYYGFFRLKHSDFYIPVDIICIKDYYDPIIDLKFNLTTRNSIFDFKCIPLKYDKTFDYINELMKALPESISEFVSGIEKDFTFLNTSFMDNFSLYFDLKSSFLQIKSRSNLHYNELTIAGFYDDQKRRLDYSLNVKGDNELLTMFLSCINIDEFNCHHLLSQSFNNYDSLMTVDSTNFIKMRNQLIQYRKMNLIYTY